MNFFQLFSGHGAFTKWKRRLPALVGAAFLNGAVLHGVGQDSSPQAGGMIYFQAQDLSNSVPGQDLWKYTYMITGFSFEANQGFSIFFEHSLYSVLQNPHPPVNADWSVIAVEPDTILLQPGFYDGQALRSSPSLADPFSISFAWHGVGTPGSQPFILYNSDFSERFAGVTVVPEPQVAWLIGICLTVFAASRKQLRREPHDQDS